MTRRPDHVDVADGPDDADPGEEVTEER
jgi:hypothetical protein